MDHEMDYKINNIEKMFHLIKQLEFGYKGIITVLNVTYPAQINIKKMLEKYIFYMRKLYTDIKYIYLCFRLED